MRVLFDWLRPANFMPHGHCYLWRPDVLWLHVGSDTLIALSYYAIPVALAAGREAAADGAESVLGAARRVLDAAAANGSLAVDYLSLVRPDTFESAAGEYAGPAVLAVAARVGSTRLIDNVSLTLRAGG